MSGKNFEQPDDRLERLRSQLAAPQPEASGLDPAVYLATGIGRLLIAANTQFTAAKIEFPSTASLQQAAAATRGGKIRQFTSSRFGSTTPPVPQKHVQSVRLFDVETAGITVLQSTHWTDGSQPTLLTAHDMSPVSDERRRRFGIRQALVVDPAERKIVQATTEHVPGTVVASPIPLQGENVFEWGNEIERARVVGEKTLAALQVPYKNYTPETVIDIVAAMDPSAIPPQ